MNDAPSPITPVTPPANTVSLGELQNPVSVQEAPPITEDFSSFVASRAPDLSGEQAAVDTSRANIQGINDKLSTRGERGEELDEQFGLADLDARNAELSAQIAEMTAGFNNAITNEEGAVRPIEFITGRQSFLRRQKATELEGLGAIQAAVQGNIALAESRIEKTLEREFGALEDQLEAEKFELTENKDAFNAKDKKATEQLERDLNERERVLTEQKETKKEILSLATEAAANGAPNTVTAQITKAETAEEALRIAGNYVGRLDRMQAQASIRSANASARNSELGAALKQQELDAISEAGNDPEEVQSSLEQFAFLRNTITEAQSLSGKRGAVGPSGVRQAFNKAFVGNSDAKMLQNKIDTLKVNLLTVAGDPNVKEFFGPQMSDNDSRLMLSAGTTMDAYANDKASLQAELARYDDLMNRMETAVRLGAQGQSQTGTFMTAPDGAVIEIID